MVYHKYKVGQALMHIQHMHMEYSKLHIFRDLVLDQNINDNAYSTPFLHEALYVDQKMIIMGIGLHQNIFSYLFVQHQKYPEHDTLCLYIVFYWIFFYIFP